MSARARKFKGVTAFTGMPGDGKTYGLAVTGARALAQGWPVWSNAGFDFNGDTEHTFASFEDFLAIPNGCKPGREFEHGGVCEHGLSREHPTVVLWDELPVFVNARKWAEFPDGLLYRLTQIRKDGLWLYYSAIDMKMVDVTVRRLTFREWKCRGLTGRLLTRALYGAPELRQKDEKPRAREWSYVNDKIAALYDTHAKVAAPMGKKSEREIARWSSGSAVSSAGGPAPAGTAEGLPSGGSALSLPAATLELDQAGP